MSQITRISWLLAATLLCGPSVAAAQTPADAVAALRQALRVPAHSMDARDRAVKQAIEALNGLGELRRALALQDWRDEDVDTQVAAIDRQHRNEVQLRFERTVRDTFVRGDATSQVAVADLLADVGIAIRAVGTQDGLGRVFSADLAGLATTGAPAVREAAVRALGQVHPDLAVTVPVLASLLTSKDDALRQAAASSLANLMKTAGQLAGRTRSASTVTGSRADVTAAAQAVLPLARRTLTDPLAMVRRHGVETFGWSVNAANSLILDSYGDEPAAGGRPLDDGRAELYPLLLSLKDNAPALARTLTDADGQTRALTRRTLEIMADLRLRWQKNNPAPDDPLLGVLKAAAPALAQCISDTDWRARRSAINVLESLGPDAAPAAGALAQALQDPDRFVRWAAARAMGKLAPVAANVAVPGLVALLGDADIDLDMAAAAALEHYGAAALPAAPALAQAVRTGGALDLRLAAIQVLGHLGPNAAPAAVPALAAVLTDPDAHVRRAAAEALGKFGPAAREAVEALRQVRGDANAEVQQSATEALLRITTAEHH